MTTASPGKEAAAFKKFLDEIRAGFVLTAPNPDEKPCDDKEPEPFNINTQTQFELDLVQLKLTGNFGVTAVVQTAVAGEFPEVEGPDTEPAAEPATGGPVPYRAGSRRERSTGTRQFAA